MDSSSLLPRVDEDGLSSRCANYKRRVALYEDGPGLDDFQHDSFYSNALSAGRECPIFQNGLAKDGTFTLVVKLWARIVRSDPSLKSTSVQYCRNATLLLANNLLVMDSPESTMRIQRLSEVNGDAKSIVAFVMMPLRDAARMKPSEFASQAALLWPSTELIHRLLNGITCERDQALVFLPCILR